MIYEVFNTERGEPILLQRILRNGDAISQQQFTQLILQQDGISDLTLLTMAYMAPKGDADTGSVTKIHNHLLKLADQGTRVHVGIDHSYARLLAPHTDIPNKLAPIFMSRSDIRAEELKRVGMYKELERHPNVTLVYHGEGRRKLLPYFRLDHRKILRIKGSPIQDFAVVYGFNMDKTLDHDVDSGTYITDTKAIEWLDSQNTKSEGSPPERVAFDDFAFITRETTKDGNVLAEQALRSIIQGAKGNLLFCSQFIPDGLILDDLVESANKGLEILVVSNTASPSRQPLYIPTRYFAERRLARACRKDNMQFYVPQEKNAFIHIKALIADIDNPLEARAITGTDNMTNIMLKWFKTREILVELLNYNYITNLYEFIRSNIFPGIRRVQF